MCLLSVSCTTEGNDDQYFSSTDSTAGGEIQVVQTAVVRKGDFPLQTITNGRVLAAQEMALWFTKPGLVERIFVKNGARVVSGQVLATINDVKERIALQEARLQMDESWVELNDLLISQGGKAKDSSSVSREIFSYIKLRSGFERAKLALMKAEIDLLNSALRAPGDGIVANLTMNPHNQTPLDKPFCTILDNRKMLVRCPILETELGFVKVGHSVQVMPIGSPVSRIAGTVVDINPVVNPHGLTDITIEINNAKGLFSGMNVKVIIEEKYFNQVIIPKRALVERSGKKVVFTLVGDKSKWNYVTVGLENDLNVSIIEGLSVGDEVICSGNLNLGHDVKVKKQELNR